MIYNNILEAMGNTPLIRLERMAEKGSAQILVKFEGLNVGGSIKTRTAYNMIRDAEEKGLLNKDTIIVEPTSGNQGIGLALVGAVRGISDKDHHAGFSQRGAQETGTALWRGSDPDP